MFVVIFCSLLALVFTYTSSVGKNNTGLKLAFGIITFIAAIHYNYGNDYMQYYIVYKQTVSSSIKFSNIIQEKELGWQLLSHFFSYIGGFFMMVAVLNIIQNICYYYFIKNNVDRKWWVLAVFIYLFNTNLYIINFSMMRQGLIVAIFVGMWPLIKSRKWWLALLVLLLSYTIHSSALFLLPFVFWGFIPVKYNKLIVFVIGILFFGFFLKSDLINTIFERLLLIEDFEYYALTYNDFGSQQTYRLGFLIGCIPLVVALVFLWKRNSLKYSENWFLLVALSCIGSLITPFGDILPIVNRIIYYFTAYRVVAIPISYQYIGNSKIRYVCLFLFIVLTLYAYYSFLSDPIYIPYFSTYHTIFEAI